MGAPLFTLLAEDTLDSAGLSYEAGAEVLDRQDEIILADDQGIGAAFPKILPPDDLDYTYRHPGGGQSRSARARLSEIDFAIDWVGADVQSKLEQWAMERRRVLLSPGYGPHTAAAMRPLVGAYNSAFRDSSSATDLTGRQTLSAPANSTTSLWSRRTAGGVMLGPWPSSSPVISTPFGAGIMSQRPYTNLMVPSSPQSATPGSGAGNAGWSKAGSGSGSITFALETDGFGHSEAPDSLRVTTTGTSASRSITAGGWSTSGTGNLVVGVWLRGRIGGNAPKLVLSDSVSGDLDEVDLSGAYFRDWTPVWVSYNQSWTGRTPTVRINLEAAVSDDANFEVGPTIAAQLSGNAYNIHAAFRDSADGLGGGSELRSLVAPIPPAGTVFASYYLPEDMSSADNASAGICGYGSPISLSVRISGGTHQVQAAYGGNTLTGSVAAGHTIGAHSIALVFGPMRKELYHDGFLVASSYTASGQAMDQTASATLALGATESGGIGAAPWLPLAVRVERSMWTPGEVLGYHLAATDPAATAVAVGARGRIYEITKVPASPWVVARGTQWRGTLGLKQVGYNHNLADIISQEVGP